ncbi:hypothetical protein GCM10008955_26710 [Deinococcus malanensis]|uniref:Uncharacterized protein n=1 Tax=Deinococcus malanensis TaxID=1706855 RepID=A0ABQ2F189_9DEIO|nr:hypothetical protein [Deinococcus malanensis]GGK31519.1 hypothetical protein GCM10008955_26710 [Deinococcus malanensis]
MTREELIQNLTNAGVSPSLYDSDSFMPDTYLLGKVDGKWSLYSHKRGHLDIEKTFDSESALHEYLW